MPNSAKDEKAKGRLANWLQRIGIPLVALLVGGTVGWAGYTVLHPVDAVPQEESFTYATVSEGSVGSHLSLNAVAEWTPIPVAANLAAGTVTTVDVTPGERVSSGTVLYSVNLRPVIIAQGDIPAFRALSVGASGQDVAQLQSMLASLGLYSYPIDGKFDWLTESCVRAWQRSLGVEDDGVVQSGDIVYAQSLPARIALDTSKIERGATLVGGEGAINALPPAPVFTIPATQAQGALMPSGTKVDITGPTGELWHATVGGQLPDGQSGITVKLGGLTDSPVCGDQCADVPVVGRSVLNASVITVDTVKGLTVPAAALQTDADGSVVVITDKGARLQVRVIAGAQGVAVIEGAPAGTQVKVPVSGN